MLVLTIQYTFGQRDIQLNNSWTVWLDKEALWQNDSLYLPQSLNLSSIRVNEPTGGRESLYLKNQITFQLPATFEGIVRKR